MSSVHTVELRGGPYDGRRVTVERTERVWQDWQGGRSQARYVPGEGYPLFLGPVARVTYERVGESDVFEWAP